MNEYGAALANDLKLAGYQFLNGPGMNLNRTPYGGRNSEYLSGEDPYIGSVIGTTAIRALQLNGIMAVVKHPLLDDQEINRLHKNVNADERTIRELYMPPFEAAAKTANASSYMCTFVSINGVQACQNSYILNDVFEGQWGFKGFVMSDYDAIQDGLAAALGGADLDMPSGAMNSDVLSPAIQSGKLPIATIDNKIIRILTQEILFGFPGFFDRSSNFYRESAGNEC